MLGNESGQSVLNSASIVALPEPKLVNTATGNFSSLFISAVATLYQTEVLADCLCPYVQSNSTAYKQAGSGPTTGVNDVVAETVKSPVERTCT